MRHIAKPHLFLNSVVCAPYLIMARIAPHLVVSYHVFLLAQNCPKTMGRRTKQINGYAYDKYCSVETVEEVLEALEAGEVVDGIKEDGGAVHHNTAARARYTNSTDQ